MSGIFSTLNVAKKGMNAQQVALNTASHNIANSTTEGYSRQRVELKADLAFTYGGIGQLGTGVKINSVVRMVDDYVTRQIRQEGSIHSQFKTKSDTLDQMEIIYNEPSDTGLNFNIAEMFESWQNLANDPGNLTAKTIVVEKSKTFADTLNHMIGQLGSLNTETDVQIKDQFKQIRATAESIDTLNGQIFNVSIKGLIPNDLLDQRDKLLKDLSVMTSFDTTFDKYGRVGIEVIDASDNPLPLIVIGENNSSRIGSFNEVTTSSGALKGYKEAQDLIIKQKAELVDYAEKIANKFNHAHKSDSAAETSYGFFTFDTASGKLSVNFELTNNPSLVLSGANYSSDAGDNTTALKIVEIRAANLEPGGNTIEGTYNGIVTKVGIEKQQSGNMVSNQEILVNQLQMRRESTSGVSLDEEFSNAVGFQKAYEANARVMSILTEMLDVLINRTGV